MSQRPVGVGRQPLDKLDYQVVDGVAIIRLNDPDTMNAVTMEMLTQLRLLLEQAESEPRCAVLLGGRRAFCSGANLSVPAVPEDREPQDAGLGLEMHMNPLMMLIRALRIPLVVGVQGAATGFGASLALSGDIIVADETAFFVQAFVHIGLVPDGGILWLLTHSIGRVRAMEFALLGERLSALKALEYGMISRIVPAGHVETEAMALAQRLAAGPRTAVSLTRRAVWDAAEFRFETALGREVIAQREAGAHPDFDEGVAAFLAKMAPRFR